MILIVVLTIGSLLTFNMAPAKNPYLAHVRAVAVTPNADGSTETPEQREKRSKNIAQVVSEVDVAGPIPVPLLRKAVLVVWRRESGLAQDVHAGKPGRNGSDRGRAACMGQLHANRKLTRELWMATKGISLEATRLCARWTAKALQSAAATCRFNGGRQAWRKVFRQYGTGNGDCRPDNAHGHSLFEINRRAQLMVNGGAL